MGMYYHNGGAVRMIFLNYKDTKSLSERQKWMVIYGRSISVQMALKFLRRSYMILKISKNVS